MLLILAGVSIATLTGQNGILTQANNAKTQTERAKVIEEAEIDVIGIEAENKGGDITKGQLKTVLDKYFKDVPEDYTIDTVLETKDEYGNCQITVSEIYDGNFADEEETVSKSELIKLWEDAKKIQREDWTIDSWEKLQEEIEKAEQIINDEKATQDEVDNCIVTLTEAKQGLKRLNKEELKAAIENVQQIVDNIDRYQPDTVVGIEEKLERGKAMVETVDVSQEDVDNITGELIRAFLDARLN